MILSMGFYLELALILILYTKTGILGNEGCLILFFSIILLLLSLRMVSIRIALRRGLCRLTRYRFFMDYMVLFVTSQVKHNKATHKQSSTSHPPQKNSPTQNPQS